MKILQFVLGIIISYKVLIINLIIRRYEAENRDGTFPCEMTVSIC